MHLKKFLLVFFLLITISIALVSVAVTKWSDFKTTPDVLGVTDIYKGLDVVNLAELKEMQQEDYLIVDLREKSEYEQKSIPNSLNFPINTPNFTSKFSGLNLQGLFLLYSNKPNDVRRFYARFQAIGVENVAVLNLSISEFDSLVK